MDKWQRRNERLLAQGREAKLKTAKEISKKIKETRKKVENMTIEEKQNRQLQMLRNVKAKREKAAAEKKRDDELKKAEKDRRLREASEKLKKWQKPSTIVTSTHLHSSGSNSSTSKSSRV